MPMYAYKGLDAQGKATKGLRDADSPKTLRALLRKDGIFVTDVKEAKGGEAARGSGSFLRRDVDLKALFQRVTAESVSLATRQLGTLLSAGVPMVDALTALIEQVENESLRKILSAVKSDVNEGLSLADAMNKHKCFSGIYVNMVRAGEASGALELVLERLADFLENQAQLRARVVSAMLYPAIMMCVAAMVMVVLFTTVIPRVTQIFQHAKVQLPPLTRIVIFVSNTLISYWWVFLLLFALGIYLFLRWLKTPEGRAKWDLLKLRAPVFGPILQMVAVARFSRTLATLLSSSVPLLTSLQIVRSILANSALEKAVDDVREAVREGEDIATPLKRSGQFPPMVTHMIAIGERSGQLESMLARVATTYEQRVQIRVGMLTSLLEPIMIVVMGFTVALIVFSILTPILQMSQLVS